MGQPLIVKVYKKTNNSINTGIDQLENCGAFPPQPLMDNTIFYGEYQIIGNRQLKIDEVEFPISYSRSLSALDRDTVYLQYGMIYLEKSIKEYSKYLVNEKAEINPFRYESIGFSVNVLIDIPKMKNVVAGSSTDTGFGYAYKNSLLNPENLKVKREIFSDFGLNADKTYAENLKMFDSFGSRH